MGLKSKQRLAPPPNVHFRISCCRFKISMPSLIPDYVYTYIALKRNPIFCNNRSNIPPAGSQQFQIERFPHPIPAKTRFQQFPGSYLIRRVAYEAGAEGIDSARRRQ